MKKIILLSFILAVSALSIAAQTKTALVAQQMIPENFESDGCTHFPNGDYLDCCFQHDLAYYNGGSWMQRWRADGQLRKCVAAKNGWWHKPVSVIMWGGVRIGGLPFLPTPYRWGFGKEKPKTPNTALMPEAKTQ